MKILLNDAGEAGRYMYIYVGSIFSWEHQILQSIFTYIIYIYIYYIHHIYIYCIYHIYCIYIYILYVCTSQDVNGGVKTIGDAPETPFGFTYLNEVGKGMEREIGRPEVWEMIQTLLGQWLL